MRCGHLLSTAGRRVHGVGRGGGCPNSAALSAATRRHVRMGEAEVLVHRDLHVHTQLLGGLPGVNDVMVRVEDAAVGADAGAEILQRVHLAARDPTRGGTRRAQCAAWRLPLGLGVRAAGVWVLLRSGLCRAQRPAGSLAMHCTGKLTENTHAPRG